MIDRHAPVLAAEGHQDRDLDLAGALDRRRRLQHRRVLDRIADHRRQRVLARLAADVAAARSARTSGADRSPRPRRRRSDRGRDSGSRPSASHSRRSSRRRCRRACRRPAPCRSPSGRRRRRRPASSFPRPVDRRPGRRSIAGLGRPGHGRRYGRRPGATPSVAVQRAARRSRLMRPGKRASASACSFLQLRIEPDRRLGVGVDAHAEQALAVVWSKIRPPSKSKPGVETSDVAARARRSRSRSACRRRVPRRRRRGGPPHRRRTEYHGARDSADLQSERHVSLPASRQNTSTLPSPSVSRHARLAVAVEHPVDRRGRVADRGRARRGRWCTSRRLGTIEMSSPRAVELVLADDARRCRRCSARTAARGRAEDVRRDRCARSRPSQPTRISSRASLPSRLTENRPGPKRLVVARDLQIDHVVDQPVVVDPVERADVGLEVARRRRSAASWRRPRPRRAPCGPTCAATASAR